MKFAKKNLRSIKDSAVEYGLSGTQEARFPRADLGAEQTGLNFFRVKPSQREAFAHRHRAAVLIFGPHVEGDGETVPDSWGEE
jgi:hypothetical protein